AVGRQAHRDHHGQPDEHVHDLPLQVRLRVAAVGQQPRLGGRPHQQHADRAQRGHDHEQLAVQQPPGGSRRDPDRGRAVGGHRLFPFGSAGFSPSRPYMPDQMSRTTGAATSPPEPPSEITATTTYRGFFAGAYEANQEVSFSPNASAVPVLPATASLSNGNPENAPAAVPDLGTSASASRM